MKFAVVGRGMIGSAAARHLAKAGQDVTLIGPAEPEDRNDHDGVFGSHYDEGRITRLLDPHPVWEDLAAASIARYDDIRAESGIAFYNPVGLLIGAPEGSEYLDNVRAVRDGAGVTCRELTGDALRRAYPYLVFDEDMVMLHQSDLAGHISPRRIVAAQTKAALAHGAALVDEFAVGVRPGAVETPSGIHHFDRVLVACGAYTNTVLEQPLALTPLARTITLFELDEAEAHRLSAMPSVIYRVPDNSSPYVLPPIRYPDGKMYLKIGGEPVDVPLGSAEALRAWFQSGGDAGVGMYHMERIAGLMPDLRFAAAHWDACAVTYTKTGLPYIGDLGDGICVAAGGCGGAAKSSDEIGRIAAETLLGRPDNRFDVLIEGDGMQGDCA